MRLYGDDPRLKFHQQFNEELMMLSKAKIIIVHGSYSRNWIQGRFGSTDSITFSDGSQKRVFSVSHPEFIMRWASKEKIAEYATILPSIQDHGVNIDYSRLFILRQSAVTESQFKRPKGGEKIVTYQGWKVKAEARVSWQENADPEKLRAWKQNIQLGWKSWWNGMGDEEFEAKNEKLQVGRESWWNGRSDDGRQDVNDRRSIGWESWWNSMTDDERKAWKDKSTDWRKDSDPERLQIWKENHKKGAESRWNGMKDEEKEAWKEKIVEGKKAWRNSMTD